MDIKVDPTIEKLIATLRQSGKITIPATRYGKILSAIGTTVKVTGVHLKIGDICRLLSPGKSEVLAEVIGLDGSDSIVMPLGSTQGLSSSSMVESTGKQLMVPHGRLLLGRVVDGFCRPLDGLPMPQESSCSVNARIALPLERQPIRERFATGVCAIDTMLTCGVGQRIGIFAPAGGGKTTLLSMIARFSDADAIVVALVGERGREVQDFMQHALGGGNAERAVIVAATSDRPAAERINAAHVASAIAESLRADGKRVLLMVDSVTRFARALREIGLAAGEPPARHGFPPSVFSALPLLFERAGQDQRGAITAFYTVLAEDGDTNDPICEEVRSLLDGHIILSDALAAAGQYPAIDILKSRSRIMPTVVTASHQRAASQVRKWLADYQASELLIRLGEYRAGLDAGLDAAVAKHAAIQALLSQTSEVSVVFSEAESMLETLAVSPA